MDINFIRKSCPKKRKMPPLWSNKPSTRYAEKITQDVIHSDFNNVAKNHQLTYEEVESMVMSVAQNIMPINVEKLQKLGIDEISLVKGQGKFIVVLVDLDSHKLLSLVAKRTQEEIKKVLLKFGEKVLV